MTRRVFSSVAGALAALALCALTSCTDQPVTTDPGGIEAGKAPGSGGPSVSRTAPDSAPQDTTLDVHVYGSGFDNGSRADFALNGVVGPKVRTNSTRFVSSKELVANVTIAFDAVADLYDVIVTTSNGKKGIGTEMFTVSLKLQDLGTLGASSEAYAINSFGHVVGHSCAAVVLNCTRGFFWNGVMESLPLLPGFAWGAAYGINDQDQVVGENELQAVLWARSGAGGAWSVYRLPVAPGAACRQLARAINNSGQAVGFGCGGLALLWTISPTDTTVQVLPRLPGYPNGEAYGINNTGQIVGGPFLWSLEAGGLITVTVLPSITSGSPVYAHSVSDLSGGILRVAGIEVTSRNQRVVRWTLQRVGTGWQIVSTVELSRNADAYGINNLGEVAGSEGGKGVVWTPAGSKQILPGSGGMARGINDQGWVVGWYVPPSCCTHAVLWRLR